MFSTVSFITLFSSMSNFPHSSFLSLYTSRTSRTFYASEALYSCSSFCSSGTSRSLHAVTSLRS
ncbi:ORF1274 [White spot syndrome virus]|uniref:ORF1274 n=1 Tax=White spot syndrome virus TaxID=342409 RepID=A0A2D3I6Y4_9VIRU|nr:ORF1274 [White spot syndrome virus]